jgi:hypothetical protein
MLAVEVGAATLRFNRHPNARVTVMVTRETNPER